MSIFGRHTMDRNIAPSDHYRSELVICIEQNATIGLRGWTEVSKYKGVVC